MLVMSVCLCPVGLSGSGSVTDMLVMSVCLCTVGLSGGGSVTCLMAFPIMDVPIAIVPKFRIRLDSVTQLDEPSKVSLLQCCAKLLSR